MRKILILSAFVALFLLKPSSALASDILPIKLESEAYVAQLFVPEPIPTIVLQTPEVVTETPVTVTWQDNPNGCTDMQWIAAEPPFVCIDKPVIKEATRAVERVSTAKSTASPTVSNSTATRARGGANTYGYGWCTWWVKNKRPDIPNNWGNAGPRWLSAARASGYSTGSVPKAGAIGVTSGHVVYVESVNGNKVNISEMGWNYTQGRLNYRTVPASSFTYIY